MESLNNQKGIPDESVKYAQQHLANERTYLAWLRTAISITGVGFLTTSIHFTIKISNNHFINTLAIFLGIYACVVGFITGVLATIQYSKKRKEIQNGKFLPANNSVILVSILFSFLIFMIVMYLSLLLFK
ncbi:YidH family protein [Gottfriedia sp. NPDC056225]|uniref:YidH family protein n=1 Tax=Gottfriedia sp. NPDC056225 TaxID=3345751 RepID=UPI0035DB14D4